MAERTLEMAEEQGLSVDRKAFDTLMREQKDRAVLNRRLNRLVDDVELPMAVHRSCQRRAQRSVPRQPPLSTDTSSHTDSEPGSGAALTGGP